MHTGWQATEMIWPPMARQSSGVTSDVWEQVTDYQGILFNYLNKKYSRAIKYMSPQGRQVCDIGHITYLFFSPNMKRNQALPPSISNKEGRLWDWNDLASPFLTVGYNAADDHVSPRAHKAASPLSHQVSLTRESSDGGIKKKLPT